MSDLPVYVYALVDPNTLRIRYVGSTLDIKMRLENHYHAAKAKTHSIRERSCKAQWIRSLQREDKQPILIVLEETTEERRSLREVFWIHLLRSVGNELTNKPISGLEEQIRLEMSQNVAKRQL